MSKREELADAIVTLLNDEANTFSLQFEAQRRAVPYLDAQSLKAPGVSVVTGSKTSERRTRTGFGHIYKPLVAVHGMIAGADEATRIESAGTFIALVEEIETLFENLDEQVAGLDFIGFSDADTDREAFNEDQLKSGVFMTSIRLEFQD